MDIYIALLLALIKRRMTEHVNCRRLHRNAIPVLGMMSSQAPRAAFKLSFLPQLPGSANLSSVIAVEASLKDQRKHQNSVTISKQEVLSYIHYS